MTEPLPQHVWEITVRNPNGDDEYMRTPRLLFNTAVFLAIDFAKERPILSIANVDPGAPADAALMPTLDLDVDAPDKVAGVLRAAAEAYNASRLELANAWQDDRTPLVWKRISGILDVAAGNIETAVKDYFDRHRPIGSGRGDLARRKK